jgi:hypothetical protein
MLEILVLISLGRSIANKAQEKGRSGVGYIFLLLALWIGGEIFGAILGVVISMAVLGDEEPNMLLAYGGALVGAVIGAVIAFQIVKALPPLHSHRDEYDEYDDRYEYPDDRGGRDRAGDRGRDDDQERDRGRERGQGRDPYRDRY